MPVTLLNTTVDLEEGEVTPVVLSAWANSAHDVRLYFSHMDLSELRGKVPLVYGVGVQSIAVQSVGVTREFGRFESGGFGHQVVMTGFNSATSLVLYRRRNNQSDRMRCRVLQVNFSL
jgi:hypothetical protein